MAKTKTDDVATLRGIWQKLVSEERMKLIDERNNFELEKAKATAEIDHKVGQLSVQIREVYQQKLQLEQLLAEYAAKRSRRPVRDRKLEEERAQFERERATFEEERRGFNAERSANHQVVKDEKYYGRLLGLRGKVSIDEIKTAYRIEAARCHPDKVQSLHPDIVDLATEKMKDLNAAWAYFEARYPKKEA